MRLGRPVVTAGCIVLGLAILTGCGGSSSAPPDSQLQLTCGTYNAGASVGLAVAVVFDPVPKADLTLAISGAGGRRDMTCQAGQRVCLAAWPEVAAWPDEGGQGHAISMSGDLGQGTATWTCRPDRAAALLPQPGGSAVAGAGQVQASWEAVQGATAYRATLRDLGPPGIAPQRVLGTVTTRGTQAAFSLDGAAPALWVVDVEAMATDPSAPPAGALSSGAANRSVRSFPIVGTSWALRQPSDFTSGSMSLPVAAGKRMAVILLNIAGADHATANLQATGTGMAAAPASVAGRAVRRLLPQVSPVPPRSLTHGSIDTAMQAFRARGGVPAPSTVAASAPPAPTTFCTPRWDAAGNPLSRTRRTATLARQTATGLFYVDDASAAEFTSADWDGLVAGWEVARASVTSWSGPGPDVDGNGKAILFFTGVLPPGMGGVTSYDALVELDTTADCARLGSNHADMIFVHSPAGMLDPEGAPIPPGEILLGMPSSFAHEFQHLVDQKRFCLDRPDCPYGDIWLMEGRAELAEALAGWGIRRDPRFRSEVFRRTAPQGGYADLRLFPFEQTYVNYSASNLLFTYLADRLGPGFLTALYQEVNTLAGLEAVSGLPFPVAYGLWTSALVFSNEPASPWPALDYTGPDWTPLHQKIQRFEFAGLAAGATVPVSLRANGFDVYVTGAAGAAGGTVTVTSSGPVKPYVVAIPFTGTLP